MRRLGPTLVLALTFTTLSCSAYVADTSIAPGDRVRVTAPSMHLRKGVGTVAALQPDTLVLNTEQRTDALQVPLAVADMTKLEVHRGQKSQIGVGALTGFVVGAAAGVGIALASCSGDGCQWGTEDETVLAAVVYGAGGGLLGALVGAMIGSIIRVDRWQDVPLDDIRVGPSPVTPDGVAVSVALRF